jgi:hypothetical protein
MLPVSRSTKSSRPGDDSPRRWLVVVGGNMAKQTVPQEHVEQVFNKWRSYRSRPEVVRLTADRIKLISDRIKLGYSADDLCTLVEFVMLADDQWAQWMRSNDYTGLDYLFRKEKLGDRVEKALNWKTPTATQPSEDLNLGYLGQLKNALREI